MFRQIRKAISIIILVAFISTSVKSPAYAQLASVDPMPRMVQPGVMVHLSPEFTPAYLKGIVIHPENALKFDFIIYKGDLPLTDAQKRVEYTKLTKYFLASLAIPDDDQWVNLSPYEKDRIIKDDFGKTEMGRDLLAQDYMLKQITASLIYPEDNLGKKFWDKVYAQAQEQFGTTNIPVNTFNKVWILPDDALIYEKGNTAYVLKNHLRVMLEEDYLSLQKHTGIASPTRGNDLHALASKIVRQIVLPELEREVNEGKNFAALRQVYSGMLLATWYKRALKESLLSKIYANKAKVKGVDQDPKTNEEIYRQYLRAYKKGVFNFIKEDVDKYTNEMIPRKYFSGGDVSYAMAARILKGPVVHESSNPALIAGEVKNISNIDFATVVAIEAPPTRRSFLEQIAAIAAGSVLLGPRTVKAQTPINTDPAREKKAKDLVQEYLKDLLNENGLILNLDNIYDNWVKVFKIENDESQPIKEIKLKYQEILRDDQLMLLFVRKFIKAMQDAIDTSSKYETSSSPKSILNLELALLGIMDSPKEKIELILKRVLPRYSYDRVAADYNENKDRIYKELSILVGQADPNLAKPLMNLINRANTLIDAKQTSWASNDPKYLNARKEVQTYLKSKGYYLYVSFIDVLYMKSYQITGYRHVKFNGQESPIPVALLTSLDSIPPPTPLQMGFTYKEEGFSAVILDNVRSKAKDIFKSIEKGEISAFQSEEELFESDPQDPRKLKQIEAIQKIRALMLELYIKDFDGNTEDEIYQRLINLTIDHEARHNADNKERSNMTGEKGEARSFAQELLSEIAPYYLAPYFSLADWVGFIYRGDTYDEAAREILQFLVQKVNENLPKEQVPEEIKGLTGEFLKQDDFEILAKTLEGISKLVADGHIASFAQEYLKVDQAMLFLQGRSSLERKIGSLPEGDFKERLQFVRNRLLFLLNIISKEHPLSSKRKNQIMDELFPEAFRISNLDRSFQIVYIPAQYRPRYFRIEGKMVEIKTFAENGKFKVAMSNEAMISQRIGHISNNDLNMYLRFPGLRNERVNKEDLQKMTNVWNASRVSTEYQVSGFLYWVAELDDWIQRDIKSEPPIIRAYHFISANFNAYVGMPNGGPEDKRNLGILLSVVGALPENISQEQFLMLMGAFSKVVEYHAYPVNRDWRGMIDASQVDMLDEAMTGKKIGIIALGVLTLGQMLSLWGTPPLAQHKKSHARILHADRPLSEFMDQKTMYVRNREINESGLNPQLVLSVDLDSGGLVYTLRDLESVLQFQFKNKKGKQHLAFRIFQVIGLAADGKYLYVAHISMENEIEYTRINSEGRESVKKPELPKNIWGRDIDARAVMDADDIKARMHQEHFHMPKGVSCIELHPESISFGPILDLHGYGVRDGKLYIYYRNPQEGDQFYEQNVGKHGTIIDIYDRGNLRMLKPEEITPEIRSILDKGNNAMTTVKRAIVVLRQAQPFGGIDFNAANLNLQIKRDGKGVPLPISQQDLENIKIDGLIPIIIDIKPGIDSPVMSELLRVSG